MNRQFWHERRVLVTGHTGFKGSWLSLWLQHLGAEVIGYGLPPTTTPNLFEAADAACGMVSIEADIRDAAALAQAFRAHRPEVVIHMAAQALVRASYEEPAGTYATNVMGTVNLMEAVRQTPAVRSVVVVTSDKCYANREWLWGYREEDPLGGRDPYSSSKACAELVTSAYSASFFPPEQYTQHGVAIASARAGNVIGGGDWAPDRLAPDIARALDAGDTIVVRNPGAIRPWQHVLEPLRGYLALAEALSLRGPEFAGAWNFGPADSDAQPVSWLVERAAKAWGGNAGWELDAGPHPHEARTLKLDCSKSRALLNWVPAVGLPTAIDRVMAWYRNYYRDCHPHAESARSLAAREIAWYEGLLPC